MQTLLVNKPLTIKPPVMADVDYFKGLRDIFDQVGDMAIDFIELVQDFIWIPAGITILIAAIAFGFGGIDGSKMAKRWVFFTLIGVAGVMLTLTITSIIYNLFSGTNDALTI